MGKKPYYGILIFFSSLFLIGCNQKKGHLELLIDEFIDYYKIDKKTNCIIINTNVWTDTTSILVIRYKKRTTNMLLSPTIPVKSSYSGMDIFFEGMYPLPVSNNLKFKKILINERNEYLDTYEEFNDIQITYHNKCDCFLEVINNRKTGTYFMGKLKRKGISCE